MKGVLDHEDRQSSDTAKQYYYSGFATISITDPRGQSDDVVDQLRKCFALADAHVTAESRRGLCSTKGGHSYTERSTKDLYPVCVSRPARRYPPVRRQDHHRARRSFRRPFVLAWQAATAAQAAFVKTSDGSPNTKRLRKVYFAGPFGRDERS